MEEIEKQQDLTEEQNDLFIDSNSKTYLKEIRKWAMFFAVLGFIFIGLILLVGLIVGIAGSSFGSFMGGAPGFLIFFVYLIIGVLYFFPLYYLLKFSTNMKTALEQSKQNDLTTAFEFLKSHYKFIGILAIVVLSLYILIGIIAAIAGVSSMI